MKLRALLAPPLILAPVVAMAQAVTSSAGPASVAVTVYRAPNRSADEAPNLHWLNGYALISEQRRITIPAGDAQIRFEGVAGGILPESAIVTGLPDGVIEKNQDAYLLSPASLLDRTLGRRVHLRRTSGATGAVREHEAIVRSGAEGAVVLQTEEGFEALRCTGIPETIVYDGVPEGLSAKPTLSVRTRSARAASANVTLSYLATGFDWQANYVAHLSPDEKKVDLFAWVTLANGDETSFKDAETQAVAGKLNWTGSDRDRDAPQQRPIRLRCWPQGTTSDIPLKAHDIQNFAVAEEIVVTGMRSMAGPPPPPPPAPPPPPVMIAQQEDLGDLKLYRIPERVTVAAQSQKQVAMLEKRGVKVEQIYRTTFFGSVREADLRTIRILKTRNRTAEGLGLPLPAGKVVLFARGHERPVLIGGGSVEDRAVGEDVEIEIGEPTGVIARLTKTDSTNDSGNFLLTVSNDRDRPVRFEAEFPLDGAQVVGEGRARLERRNGRPLWVASVPANGTASLSFRLEEQR